MVAYDEPNVLPVCVGDRVTDPNTKTDFEDKDFTYMKSVVCRSCKETYTSSDLRELRLMREPYYLEGETFYCPDCYDNMRRKDLEDLFETLVNDNG